MFNVVSSARVLSQFDNESQGSWKESNSDDLPSSLLWWSGNKSLTLISDPVKCHHLWRVLKWVNEHHFPDFLQIVSCCRVWRVLKWVNVHTFTGFCFWWVLKGVSLCCYTAHCLDSGCPIHFVWWCTVVLVASQPLPWLHGGCSLGLHGELSSAGLHGDLSSVHWGLPGLLGSHGLHGGLSSSVLRGDLPSVHGGLPGLLGVSLGCLSACFLALYGWGWVSLVMLILLIVSPFLHLWLISCLKWNLNHLLVPCHNVLF